MSDPRPVEISMTYSDGSRKAYNSGLLAHITPSGGVELLTMGLHPPEFLTLLAALEGATERIVKDSQ